MGFTDYVAPKYVPHLIKIAANDKVRMIPNEKARNLFNSWRKEWRENQKQYNDRTGFVNRIPDHVLKVSMCLALSRYEDNTTIIESDINEAISECFTLELTYANEKAASGSGVDPLAAATKKVMNILIAIEGNQILRRDLLVRGYGDYDPVAFGQDKLSPLSNRNEALAVVEN